MEPRKPSEQKCKCGCGEFTLIARNGRINQYILNHHMRGRSRTRYRPGQICKIKGCSRLVRALEMCQLHYARMIYNVDIEKEYVPRQKREGVNVDGYRVIRVNGERHLEHRYNMEQYLGRLLYDHEFIHHKSGDRLDNSIENLEIWTKSHPPRQRVKDLVQWAEAFLAQYE